MTPILAVLLATQLSHPTMAPKPESFLELQMESIGSGSDGAPAPYSATTIVAQSLTGAGATIVAGLGGFLVGALVAGDGGHGFAALGGGLIGALVASPIGFGVGVWATGAIRGHDGSFWATMGTIVLGSVLSFAALALEAPLALVLTLPATAVGAIWVYHFTDARSRNDVATTQPEARPEHRREATPSRELALVRFAF